MSQDAHDENFANRRVSKRETTGLRWHKKRSGKLIGLRRRTPPSTGAVTNENFERRTCLIPQGTTYALS